MGTNRRNLLAAAVVLPLAGCVTPALAGTERRAIPAETTGDDVWDRLYATFRTAEAEEANRLAVFAPLDDAWTAQRHTREPEPQRPTVAPYDMSLPMGEAITVAAGPDWEARWDAYEADRKAWQAREDAAYAAHIGDTGDRYEAATDACSAVVGDCVAHPVVTLSALAKKAELILTRFGDTVDGDDALALIADIRRLAGQEARA